MEKKQNNEPQLCYEKNTCDTSAAPSCSCSSDGCCGTSVDRNKTKIAIFICVLLSVGGILAYKTISANSNTVDNNVPLAYATEISGSTTANAAASNADQAGLNFGKRIESLNDLNKIALNEDIVFVFLPGSENDLADGVTSAAALAAQKSLQENKVAAGLYTLTRSSPNYSEMIKQMDTPAILIARKGGGMLTMSGNNVSKDKFLQAYLACCGTSGSSCCP